MRRILRHLRSSARRSGTRWMRRVRVLLNDFRGPAILCHRNGRHDDQDVGRRQDAASAGEEDGGGGGGSRAAPETAADAAPLDADDEDANRERRLRMLQYRSGDPAPPPPPPPSVSATGRAISGLEIVPEEDPAYNDEQFPLPPPPPQSHRLPPPSSASVHHFPPASSSVAATSQLPPPPSTAGVWSVFVSSSSKDENVIRFYLEQMFTNTREVIAFICGLIVFLLMILCLASSDWLLADKFRQGLWVHCIAEDAPLPLPFNITDKAGKCYAVRNMGYIQASAAFCVFCLLFDVVATAMTGCGLYSKDPVLKYKLYRFAVYTMIVALVCILIALIVYPSCFSSEIEMGNRRIWEFGWAYGVGWGAAIFLFGAVVLLLCDKESEEIYYKERTIIHDNNESKAIPRPLLPYLSHGPPVLLNPEQVLPISKTERFKRHYQTNVALALSSAQIQAFQKAHNSSSSTARASASTSRVVTSSTVVAPWPLSPSCNLPDGDRAAHRRDPV